MRITRELMFLRVAEVVALRGTCSRAQVGAVLVRDNRIISIGYNGAPAGMPHCDHETLRVGSEGGKYLRDAKSTSSGCEIAVHAETNAIMYAARSGTITDASEMYSTHEPCLRCAQLILTAGVRSVMYLHDYRLKEGSDLLRQAGIPVVKYTHTPDPEPIPQPHRFMHGWDENNKRDTSLWNTCRICGKPRDHSIHESLAE